MRRSVGRPDGVGIVSAYLGESDGVGVVGPDHVDLIARRFDVVIEPGSGGTREEHHTARAGTGCDAGGGISVAAVGDEGPVRRPTRIHAIDEHPCVATVGIRHIDAAEGTVVGNEAPVGRPYGIVAVVGEFDWIGSVCPRDDDLEFGVTIIGICVSRVGDAGAVRRPRRFQLPVVVVGDTDRVSHRRRLSRICRSRCRRTPRRNS